MRYQAVRSGDFWFVQIAWRPANLLYLAHATKMYRSSAEVLGAMLGSGKWKFGRNLKSVKRAPSG